MGGGENGSLGGSIPRSNADFNVVDIGGTLRMSGQSNKKYEHFDNQKEYAIPVISGSGGRDTGQNMLAGKINKWVRLRKLPDEDDSSWVKRIKEDQKNIDKFSSHLLVAQSFDTRSSRLTAIASARKNIGYSWMPVIGDKPPTFSEAKACAVWLNSTLGRIALRRVCGRKISWPRFNPMNFNDIPFPDVDNPEIIELLSLAYDLTCNEIVPKFKDGISEIRTIWDDAISEAIQIDRKVIDHCAELLARDPYVSGEPLL